MKIYIAILLTTFCCTAIHSQKHDLSLNQDASTDCSKEYSFRFVRFGRGDTLNSDESIDRVWLEFTNTSRKELLVKAADTQISMDYLNGKGQEATVYYEVVNKTKCDAADHTVSERPVGYVRRDVYYMIRLKPGQSFEMNVDRHFLSAGRAVYFIYEFPSGKQKLNSRKAYFFAEQLPDVPIKPNR